MSQEKVDRYKEEKRNREKILKKEKRQTLLMKIGGAVVGIALVGWIGFSVYHQAANTANASGKTYSVDTAALDNYMNNMSAAESEDGSTAETEAVTEGGTEAATESSSETEAATEAPTEAVTEAATEGGTAAE
ncbi:MAG: hypothetical protein UDG86_04405 [Lachnospiraceae bacterium]|jgi:cytoskeletal protein RodZ|nr:hypothetical protein [Lachnospiraceae bacterium]